jgi:hypothetical protein
MTLKKSAASVIKKVYNNARQNYSSKVSGSKSLLYNKYVLYLSALICFMNVLGWLFSKEFVPVVIFILAGYLTSLFSKNMIVILVIAFVVSNVSKLGLHVAMEGMENKEKKEGDKNTKENTKENRKDKKEGMGEEHEEDNSVKDESRENVDEKPCTVDSDCSEGNVCDGSRFICVAK